MRVLLVEDDKEFAAVVSRNLTSRGHIVQSECTAEDGWASLIEEWPDALLLEINLPDASGWEVLQGLSASDRDQVHVVVISGTPFSQIRIHERGRTAPCSSPSR